MIDGDTFMTESRKHPVRLAGVDTPEKSRPGYGQAKEALSRLITGKTVEIDTTARVSYGRSVANVKVGGTSVNPTMKRHSE